MARKKRSNKPGTPREKRNDRSRGKRGKGPRTPQSNQQDSQGGVFKIKLKAMAHGGYALGSHQRRTTFVPYTIPGEMVRSQLVERQKSVDFAEGVELLQASADRVFPQCPHFGPGRCWGCQWQHIDYQAQLLLKQDVLTDQLYRLGKFDDPTLERAVQPLVPSPQQWGYNYHMSYERDAAGQLGFYKADGRSIAAIEECHVLHPDLQALYELIDIDFEHMQRLSLYRGSDGATMLVISLNSEDAPQLKSDMPTSVNVILPDNEPMNLVGDSVVYYEIGGRLLRMTAGGSFRANVAQIDNLVLEVIKMLQLSEHDSVLDLYAGVGLFSAFIAARAGLVTMVESYPPMATDAEENLKDFDNVDIIEGSVEAVLQELVANGDIYEKAILDPPSSGLSKRALDSLSILNIPRVVYISSDPASLARDGRALSKQGYTLQKVQPFDFAPQTYYIDSAALFVKE